MQLVARLGGAGDRAGRMFVTGFLSKGLMEVGVELSADGVDANGLMLLQDSLKVTGHHFHAVEQMRDVAGRGGRCALACAAGQSVGLSLCGLNSALQVID